MLGEVAPPGLRARSAAAGFTVIEMMVVVMVSAVILALAVPSFRDFIARQRVAAVNAELLTSLQLARSEAVARNREVYVTFQTEDLPGQPPMTCYTVHTRGASGRCDCRNPIGTACPAIPEVEEIRTVQVLRSTNVTLSPPSLPQIYVMFTAHRGLAEWPGHAPEAVAGWADFVVGVQSSISGKLRTSVHMSGRPTACSPDASIRGAVACD